MNFALGGRPGRWPQGWARRRRLWVERLLFCAGLLVAGVLACVQVRVWAAQKAAEVEVARDGEAARGGEAAKGGGAANGGGATVVGRLEIAALKLSVPILSDIDAASLRRGVGKVPGTANPGGLGNLVLAGHRDTFFRPLRRIAAGTEIEVGDRGGRYRYVVDRTEIVDPQQVDVLLIGDRPELTLVTCYPFEYVGAAPRRFIVHAHLDSALAMR